MTGPAFWFSLATVGYWAFWNFHRPYPPDTLRYSVTLRRYLLGVGLHIAAALTIFLLTLICASLLQQILLPRLLPEARTGLPLTAALLATVLLPRLPGTGFLADETRRLLHGLALFPASAERLTRLLAAAGCRTDEETHKALRREMEIFGLAADALDHVYPPVVVARLAETHALCLRADKALKEERLSAFAQARDAAIKEARLEHLRLLRRVARATLLATELADASKPDAGDDEHPGLEALSEFVLEESKAVAARYHRLVAEAALSMFHRQQKRDDFLARLGFGPPKRLDLPFGSIVVVAGVVPATALLFYAMPLLAWAGVMPQPGSSVLTCGRPSPSPVLAFTFSLLQLTIVLWAVLPKALTRWAWPRPGALPLPSYALAALGAFATQTALGALLVSSGLMPLMSRFCISSMEVMLVTGLFAVVSTLGLCVLIDFRLLDDRFRFSRHRWLDGLMLGGAMALADAFVVQKIILWLGATSAPGLPATAIMAMLGFVHGTLVPSSVAAWLNHRLARVAKKEAAGASLPVRTAAKMD